MWDHPGSGIEPMSPALAGGFFTNEPPGKLQAFLGFIQVLFKIFQWLIQFTVSVTGKLYRSTRAHIQKRLFVLKAGFSDPLYRSTRAHIQN